ncbi:MAG: conjugal transfer protein TraF [Planctomycetes bacterium]|nr:conjugal transfer protein TraF [Planctomycetota bacterium]
MKLSSRASWLAFLSFVLLLSDRRAEAQPFLQSDTRPRAMGGAGVAAAEGASASYWNPANLARGSESLIDISLSQTEFSLSLFADAEARGNVIQAFDDLSKAYVEEIDALQNAFNAGNAGEDQVRRVFQLVDRIADLDSPGTGALGDTGVVFDLKMGNLAISYRLLGLVSAVTDIDTTVSALADNGANDLARVADGLGSNDRPSANSFASDSLVPSLTAIGLNNGQANELAFQTEQILGNKLNDAETQRTILEVVQATGGNTAAGSAQATLRNNRSSVLVKGIAIQEVAFAYGFPVYEDKLRLGLAPKVQVGTTFFNVFDISDTQDDVSSGDDVIQELEDIYNNSRKTETTFNVDVGAAFVPWDWLEVGVAGKNLIPAEFEFKQPADGRFSIPDFELDPQARAGVLVRPFGWKWLKLAADADLTKNSTSLFGNFQQRVVGGGFEISPTVWIFQVALRGGVLDNVEESGDGRTYTAGLGLRTGIFYLAAEGRISDDTTLIGGDGDNLPSRAGISVNFGINVRF